jgi:hypothetical protein
VSVEVGENGYPILRSRKAETAWSEEGALRIRFDPGFGLNVYIEMWATHWVGKPVTKQNVCAESLGMSIQGWERLCELVHEYEAWRA